MPGETMFKLTDAQYKAQIGSAYHQGRFTVAMRALARNTDLRGLRLFDFGCGEGSFMRQCAERGAIVSGCDVSPELTPPNATVGGVEVLEAITAGSLDAIASLSVTSFLMPDDQLRFWKATARALRPGGLLLHSVGNEIAIGAMKRRFIANPNTFPALLASHGLREIDTDFFNYYPVLYGRGKRTVNMTTHALIPKFIKRRRCSMYLSLSIRS